MSKAVNNAYKTTRVGGWVVALGMAALYLLPEVETPIMLNEFAFVMIFMFGSGYLISTVVTLSKALEDFHNERKVDEAQEDEDLTSS